MDNPSFHISLHNDTRSLDEVESQRKLDETVKLIQIMNTVYGYDISRFLIDGTGVYDQRRHEYIIIHNDAMWLRDLTEAFRISTMWNHVTDMWTCVAYTKTDSIGCIELHSDQYKNRGDAVVAFMLDITEKGVVLPNYQLN